MPRFFVEPDKVSEKKIIIEGDDVNHIGRVLRMRTGETVVVSDGTGKDYSCVINSIEPDAILLDVENSWASYTELPVQITLFQGLPKADKMELIIQKTVELGVHQIVPVAMSRSIVKLDDKKVGKKTQRWQGIAESAAKQSGRSIIPEISEPMTYSDAVKCASEMDAILFPYENAEGITRTREVIDAIKRNAEKKLANNNGDSYECGCDEAFRIALFIGPEGGFSDDEVSKAESVGAEVITLGKRILRTETAGLAAMSILMYEMEK